MRFINGVLFLGVSSIAWGLNIPKAVSFKSTPVTVEADKTSEVKLLFSIATGMHIQANPSDPPLIPTEIALTPVKNIEPFSPVYPEGHKTKITSIGKEISTYENQLEVKIPLKVAKNASNGKVEGTIRYQACDSSVCYPPDKISFSFPVKIKK